MDRVAKLKYLLEKEQVAGLGKAEKYELQKLLNEREELWSIYQRGKLHY